MKYYEISYTLENAEPEDYELVKDIFNEMTYAFQHVQFFEHHQTLVRVKCGSETSITDIKEVLTACFQEISLKFHFHVSESLSGKFKDFSI